jgi:endonuclease-3
MHERKIGWILKQMHREAKKRDAPVLRAEYKKKGTPFKILVFTMLSARTKDEMTAKVGKRLFREAETPEEVYALGRKKLEKLLYGVGFYRMKAKNLLKTSKIIMEKGSVPDTLPELLKLPGIGRKTANIILARAFGKTALGVDVHVHRISNRLGLVKTKKPEETEKALVKRIPPRYLRTLNSNFVAFGQTVCLPRKPMCPICPLNRLCRRVNVKEPCKECRYE